MKKITYSFLAVAFLFMGVSTASADQIYLPFALHLGTSGYTVVTIENQSAKAVRVSIKFSSNVVDASGTTTNTNSSSTSATVVLAANGSTSFQTKDSTLWGTTTSVKRAVVVIQTSATDSPGNQEAVTTTGGGPVTVSSQFVFVDSSGNPTGFSFPAFYRTRTWTSGASSLVSQPGAVPGLVSNGSITVDNWEQ